MSLILALVKKKSQDEFIKQASYNKKTKTIALSRQHLQSIIQYKELRHKNNKHYTIAAASLIHELAHHYDFLNLRSENEKKEISRCRNKFFSKSCRRIKNNFFRQSTISSHIKFLKLAKWHKKKHPQIKPLRPSTADSYQWQSPEEMFAVQFEYFILDPFYAQKKPAWYSFLNSHFSVKKEKNPEEKKIPTKISTSKIKAKLSRVFKYWY